MGALVYNLRGATEENPCPTRPSSFFREPKCTREDFRAWRDAARAMYVAGLLPMLAQLQAIEVAAGDTEQSSAIRAEVNRYAQRWILLPADGSAFFPGRNGELVAEAVSIMMEGEALLQALRTAIAREGEMPVAYDVPPKPAAVTTHSALRAYAFPIAVGAAGLVVGGLTLWAIFGRKDDEGKRAGDRR